MMEETTEGWSDGEIDNNGRKIVLKWRNRAR